MLMFVQISPSDNDVSETVSSLKFASRVCRIELGLAKKQVDTAEFQKTKQMVSLVHFPDIDTHITCTVAPDSFFETYIR